METAEISTWQIILTGGPLMAPILLCSILAVWIIAEKMICLSEVERSGPEFKKTLFDLIKNNQIKEALLLCDQNPAPIAKILRSGILRFGSSRQDVKEALAETSALEIPRLAKRLPALAVIAYIAPFLGLLGTVTGIASSFYVIQIHSASLKPITPLDLAGGIWQALVVTAAGLLVAITAYAAHAYLAGRINAVILEMERAGAELADMLSQNYEPQTPGPDDTNTDSQKN